MLGRKQKSTERKRLQQTAPGAPVFSYYANRLSQDVPMGRGAPPRRNFNWKHLPSYLAIMLIIISLIYVSTLSSNPRILPHGDDQLIVLQPTETYRRAASELLDDSVFNYSKLLIRTKDLERKLGDQFPELKGVSITIPLVSRRPIIAIESTDPALVIITPTSNYIIDNEGRAILKTNNLDKFASLKLPRITDESGLEPTLGKTSMPSATTDFIREIMHQLTAKHLEIESLTLPKIANELHVRAKGEGYVVKFNILGDPRTQAGTYLAINDRLAHDNIKPAEYIDVRVEEKVYYK
jgi:hypothetical protein